MGLLETALRMLDYPAWRERQRRGPVDGKLVGIGASTYVEICELADHPWFLGCQFHPEFKSKPLEPHPLFRDFIGAAIEHRQRRMEGALGGRGQEAHSESVHSAASKL